MHMCTLTIRFDPGASAPVAVAANRDELYRRPSSPPAVIKENPAVFAPRDREAGGTWLGVNEHSIFASITNVWIRQGRKRYSGDPGGRSRGLLTLDALSCRTVEEAAHTVEESVSRDTYQFFNLAVVSPTAGIIFTYTGSLKGYPMHPGVTTILNSPYDPHVDRTDALPPYPSETGVGPEPRDAWLQQVTTYLSQHPDICRHGRFYGTRCSHIVTLSSDKSPRFWYADGPPCQSEFHDMSPAMEPLYAAVHTSSGR
ncbi:MAG: NRDE family protein [Fidelibacterota bacterium]